MAKEIQEIDLLELIDSNEERELDLIRDNFEVLHYEGREYIVQKILTTSERMEFLESLLLLSRDKCGFINPVKAEIAFNVLILMAHTNINIGSLPLETIFDIIYYNTNILEEVLKVIPEDEYNSLREDADKVIEMNNENAKTFVGAMNWLSQSSINGINDLSESMKKLNPDELEYVQQLAKATGQK